MTLFESGAFWLYMLLAAIVAIALYLIFAPDDDDETGEAQTWREWETRGRRR